jgi:hypothetical protein
MQLAEAERILRIRGDARILAAHAAALQDQLDRVDLVVQEIVRYRDGNDAGDDDQHNEVF